MSENPSIKEAETCLPPNLNYRSPEIQNEIVSSAAYCAQIAIANKIKEAPFFAVMVDGTRDRNGEEILFIVFRYIMGSTCEESLLALININELNVKSIANAIFSTIDKFGLDNQKFLIQCYDGASVMSGKKGGVHKIIEDHFQRKMPFVHCFNHRLHLVATHSIRSVRAVNEFFDYLRAIHNFFSLFNAKKHYEEASISRLLPTRWSSHYQPTKSKIDIFLLPKYPSVSFIFSVLFLFSPDSQPIYIYWYLTLFLRCSQ